MSALEELFDRPVHKNGWLIDTRTPEFGKLADKQRALVAVVNAVRAHKDDWDEWFAAFLLALEATQDVHEAISVADEVISTADVAESREDDEPFTGTVIDGDQVRCYVNGVCVKTGREYNMRIDPRLPVVRLVEDAALVSGPESPGTGWVLDHVGPRGGKYWRKDKAGGAASPIETPAPATPAPAKTGFTGTILDKKHHVFVFKDGDLVSVGHEGPEGAVDTSLPVYRTPFGEIDDTYAKEMAFGLHKAPERYTEFLVDDYKPPKPIPEDKSYVTADGKLIQEAIDHIDSVKKYIRDNTDDSTLVDDVADRLDLTEDEVKAKATAAFDKAEWTINVNPLRSYRMPEENEGYYPAYQFSYEQLVKDKELKNQFQTHTSDGSLVHYTPEEPENERTDAEYNHFGIGYDDMRWSLRPKYGAVNWKNSPRGGAAYGAMVFVLNKDKLKGRVTLTPSDSFGTNVEEAATAEEPMNAILRNRQGLQAAGLEYDDNNTTRSGYTELQVHGPLPINKDTVTEIRLPKAIAGNKETEYDKVRAAVKQMAEELGIKYSEYESDYW